MSIQPLIIPDYGQALLDLRSRLKSTLWTEEMFAGTEETGMPVSFLQDLCTSWKDEFDWQAQVRRFPAFSQYRYLRNGFGIHFLLQRGHGPSPIPLIVTHGWPARFWKC
jgi:hypothetical protein